MLKTQYQQKKPNKPKTLLFQSFLNICIYYQVENFPWTCSLLHKAVYQSQ